MLTDSPTFIPGAIQEPAARLRQLFEEAPVAYHEIDRGGVIRDVNQAECALLGYSYDELIGRDVCEFVAEELRQTAREAIAKKIARVQPLGVVNREYRRADGSYIWLEIHERLIENDAGEVVGIRSALVDVTERRASDEERQRKHDWMRLVLKCIGSAVVATDTLGKVNFMNPAGEALTGWQQTAAIGHMLEEVCCVQHESGAPVDLISCILSERVTSNHARKFLIADKLGARHNVQWNISPVANDHGVITGAVLVLEKR